VNTTVVNQRDETWPKRGGDYVFVARPSKWGNPFHIGRDGSRAEVIVKYTDWVIQQPHLMSALPELRGKRLGCYCAPAPCHADVLASLADLTAMEVTS